MSRIESALSDAIIIKPSHMNGSTVTVHIIITAQGLYPLKG